ncbi:hypothetical protein [Kitasatospora sp. NPDC087314]|uniref:hypothetical protein n=1 Tax=Kitasatospora sp. NPDC087314 TaxID=3364068 RepID=UPI003826AC28
MRYAIEDVGHEDAQLVAALAAFNEADTVWQAITVFLDASASASDRANAMQGVVDLVGQTEAAPLLNLDQSTISRTLSRRREPHKIPSLPLEVVELLKQHASTNDVGHRLFEGQDVPGAFAIFERAGQRLWRGGSSRCSCWSWAGVCGLDRLSAVDFEVRQDE